MKKNSLSVYFSRTGQYIGRLIGLNSREFIVLVGPGHLKVIPRKNSRNYKLVFINS